MKKRVQKSHQVANRFFRKAGVSAVLCLLLGFSQSAFSSGGGIITEDTASLSSAERAAPFSPYAQRNFPNRPLWGDTHLHTAISFDAGAFGARLLPPDAYRFAKGALVPKTFSIQASARATRRPLPLP